MKSPYDDINEYLDPREWRIVEDALAGDRSSMRGLAELYEHWWRDIYYGDGETRKRPGNPDDLFRLAFRWRVRAAEAGDVPSMCWVSVYMVRYGKQFDIMEEMAGGLTSLDWQRRAAEAGDRYAMKWMGDICTNPDYEYYNMKEAIQWYERSAQAGCIYAMHELAVRSERGIGCPKNPEGALAWYEESARGLDRWWDLARMERKVAMEDLATTVEMHLRRKSDLSEEKAAWLIERLTEAEKMLAPTDSAEKLLKIGNENMDLIHRLRKAKMRMYNRSIS